VTTYCKHKLKLAAITNTYMERTKQMSHLFEILFLDNGRFFAILKLVTVKKKEQQWDVDTLTN